MILLGEKSSKLVPHFLYSWTMCLTCADFAVYLFVVINLSYEYDSMWRPMSPSSENHQTQGLSWGLLMPNSWNCH